MNNERHDLNDNTYPCMIGLDRYDMCFDDPPPLNHAYPLRLNKLRNLIRPSPIRFFCLLFVWAGMGSRAVGPYLPEIQKCMLYLYDMF